MVSTLKGRVIIVEDDALVAKLIESTVERQGYRVVGLASNGQNAVEVVARLRPDVVLMDLQMPGMDGIEATRRIQEACPTPVVVLTAHDDLKLTAEAAAAGVGAYLVKPPQERELARAITLAQARFAEEQAARDRAAELATQNEDLSAFAHTVAHDLRNALTGMVGIVDLMGEDLDDADMGAAQSKLHVLARQGRRLSRMVDDLLLLAEVRQRDLEPGPVDMAELLDDAWQQLAPMAAELDARFSAPDTWPVALGYGPWLVLVWLNYLSNALKYGGRPPHVEAGWDADAEAPGQVRFWVRDNGPGLTAGDQERLFAAFIQLDERSPGYGLGLSIVRRIVTRLGGQVGVESRVGEGSTFWFTLPRGS
ncbi:MAG TPA: hybrid sensor histidine kinase/response regulator [Anaerolineae bacterium]|nr:hybrid sensor histidine kinase/response regulator [Anaerolineae bacterium]